MSEVIPDEPPIQFDVKLDSLAEFMYRIKKIRYVLAEKVWKGGVELIADDDKKLSAPALSGPPIDVQISKSKVTAQIACFQAFKRRRSLNSNPNIYSYPGHLSGG